KADDWTSANVSVVGVASGEIKALAATAAVESQPIYSPDGKWIALTVSDDPPTWAFQNRINIVSADGGAPASCADFRRTAEPDRMGGGRQAHLLQRDARHDHRHLRDQRRDRRRHGHREGPRGLRRNQSQPRALDVRNNAAE